MDSKSAMVHNDFNVGLIVAENPQGLGKPRHLVPGQNPRTKDALAIWAAPPRRFASHLDLRQR